MKTERALLILANLLLLTAFLILTQSCSSFEKAFRRYGTTQNDTTFTTVVTSIPRDSAVLVVRTDTTHIIERVRQGRATVTIIREPTNTTVLANCDSVYQQQQVPTRIVTQRWGVDPTFKTKADRWQTIAFVLMGIIGVTVIGYAFTRRFKIVSR